MTGEHPNRTKDEVSRLERENEALRRLLVPSGECEHEWSPVTYGHEELPRGFSWKLEYECLKCLKRKHLND